MSKEFNIHPFNNSCKKEIFDLFSLCFNNRKINEKYYDWRFLHHPTGKTFIDLILNQQGKVVSHYAVCASNSFYSGEKIISGLSMVTMTHPDFHGKGLFPALAEHLYQRINQNDQVNLIYGFPNINSHYGFTNKLQWQDVYSVPTLKRKVTAKNQGKYPSNVSNNFDRVKIDSLWDRVNKASQYFFANARDSKFIEWRFVKCPVIQYEILTWERNNTLSAYAVVKPYLNIQNKELDLVDILADDSMDFQALMNDINDYAAFHNYDTINTWLPLGSKLYGAAEKFGFVPMAPLTYLGFRLLGSKQNLTDLQKAVKWYITMADSDIY